MLYTLIQEQHDRTDRCSFLLHLCKISSEVLSSSLEKTDCMYMPHTMATVNLMVMSQKNCQ